MRLLGACKLRDPALRPPRRSENEDEQVRPLIWYPKLRKNWGRVSRSLHRPIRWHQRVMLQGLRCVGDQTTHFCVAARDAMRDLAVRPCEVEMFADRPLALTGSLTRWYLQCCKASGHWRSGEKKTRSLIARTRMLSATKSWRVGA